MNLLLISVNCFRLQWVTINSDYRDTNVVWCWQRSGGRGGGDEQWRHWAGFRVIWRIHWIRRMGRVGYNNMTMVFALCNEMYACRTCICHVGIRCTVMISFTYSWLTAQWNVLIKGGSLICLDLSLRLGKYVLLLGATLISDAWRQICKYRQTIRPQNRAKSLILD